MPRGPAPPCSNKESPRARPEVPKPEGPAPIASQPAFSSSSLPSSRPPTASPAVDGSLLRQAAWGGMAAGGLLEAGLARVLFYPTLLYTMFRGKVPGRAHRDWYHRIDHTVLLGALPLRSMTRRVSRAGRPHRAGRGRREWKRLGVEQLRLSTVDMTGIPTLANLQKGVQFVLKYQSLGQSVYVHCKAGRSRSATMVAAYLIQMYNWSPEEAVRAITKIRSHVYIRPGQMEILKEFHREIITGAAKDETSHITDMKHVD
ncbi:phosphatidylglycerophosphatase and protein-tyrosine phosphatase 1 [Pteropus vampyrus]|uniref:Phosphatidylglycerophosphatase and protein-tyrosine phosphatase 1 n=1 Tax=Pteropus vampyrus TaxID=132908 RepID=A0A6P3PZK2_PTEVA|nr:phosphatidylglycerophosphatase and protein-tyrosine phosphatase 1 [Pteropus vampyrus]